MWRSPQTNAVNFLLCLIWLGNIKMSTSVSSCCRKRNLMSWTRNIRCYFFLFAKLPVVKTNSENYSHTSRFRSIKLVFILLFFILLHCMLHNILWSVWTEWCSSIVHSACPQSIYISHWLAMKREISWKEEFRFPYAKQFVGIYKWR